MPSLFDRLCESRGWTGGMPYNVGNPIVTGRPPNWDTMLDNLIRIHNEQSLVVIYPDFDCDGIMSGVTLHAGLSLLEFKVGLMVPDNHMGYGMPPEGVDLLRFRFQNDMTPHTTIITCDMGISEFEGINHSNSMGIDVLVTDHHQPANTLPNAKCIVDPQLAPHCGMEIACGARVAYTLVCDLAKRMGRFDINQALSDLAVFAAIGTVSDVMEMRAENHELVKRGIEVLDGLAGCEVPHVGNRVFDNAFEGLFQLIAAIGVEQGQITDETISFNIAPILNSPRRLGEDVAVVFDQFAGCDNALSLIKMNERRRQLTSDIVDALSEAKQPYAPYVYVGDVPATMAGLVANKLMRASGKPTVVLDARTLGGSGRSPYDVRKMLVNAGISAHGHEQAFGCSCADAAELSHLLIRINVSHVPAARTAPTVTSGELADADLAGLWLTLDLLAPFGEGFERPQFHLVIDKADVDHVSALSGGKHQKVILKSGIEVLEFNCTTPEFDLMAHLDRSTWGGSVRYEFVRVGE